MAPPPRHDSTPGSGQLGAERPAALQPMVVARAVVPRDHDVRDQPKDHAVGLLQRAGEPPPALRLAVPRGDPLQPVIAVVLPHRRRPVEDDGPVRALLAGDRDRHGGPGGQVPAGVPGLHPGGEPEGPVGVEVPERPNPWALVRIDGGPVAQADLFEERLQVCAAHRHRLTPPGIRRPAAPRRHPPRAGSPRTRPAARPPARSGRTRRPRSAGCGRWPGPGRPRGFQPGAAARPRPGERTHCPPVRCPAHGRRRSARYGRPSPRPASGPRPGRPDPRPRRGRPGAAVPAPAGTRPRSRRPAGPVTCTRRRTLPAGSCRRGAPGLGPVPTGRRPRGLAARVGGAPGLALLHDMPVHEEQAEGVREVLEVLRAHRRGLAGHVGLEAVPVVPGELGHAIERPLLSLRHPGDQVHDIAPQVLVPVPGDRRVRGEPVVAELLVRHPGLPAHPDVCGGQGSPPPPGSEPNPTRRRREGLGRYRSQRRMTSRPPPPRQVSVRAPPLSRSGLGPPRSVSLPAPPLSRSGLGPPRSVSLPPLPFRRSRPPWPRSRWSPPCPMTRSFPAPPATWSLPDRPRTRSFPAPPATWSLPDRPRTRSFPAPAHTR